MALWPLLERPLLERSLLERPLLRRPLLEVALSRLLQHALPLLRRCVLPLLTQLLAPFGGKALKAAKVLAHVLLLLGRQRAELLPPLLQHLTSGRR